MSVQTGQLKKLKERKMGDFAQGLKDFFTKGTLVKTSRLTPGVRKIIQILMDESLSRTSIDFPESYQEESYNKFMESMEYLKEMIRPGSNKNRKMPIEIAARLYFWLNNYQYHHLSDEEDFKKAVCWIISHISKRYAISELADK